MALLELLQLGGRGTDWPGAVHHLGDRAAARRLAHVLVEVADGDAAIDGHLALIEVLLARHHPEQRRLARAVRIDETDLVAETDPPFASSTRARVSWGLTGGQNAPLRRAAWANLTLERRAVASQADRPHGNA